MYSYAQCMMVIGCPKTEKIMKWVGLRSAATGVKLSLEDTEATNRLAMREMTQLLAILRTPVNLTKSYEQVYGSRGTPALNEIWSAFVQEPTEYVKKLTGLTQQGLFQLNYPTLVPLMQIPEATTEFADQHYETKVAPIASQGRRRRTAVVQQLAEWPLFSLVEPADGRSELDAWFDNFAQESGTFFPEKCSSWFFFYKKNRAWRAFLCHSVDAQGAPLLPLGVLLHHQSTDQGAVSAQQARDSHSKRTQPCLPIQSK